ncbi:hypothetical protein VA7868_02673 [Vibrio aerogenes CECT 7868]|uniref:Uncharacterized protein n=1 Tax=Vibrio aerogenes CECT 7868 TaxID=1216006 RepID=A0A1M5ZFN1_9VIBR|nr:hypothetical protein [Vibrio aerogenes]SHI22999.1 hypothetical protein VA7868_02673 [Vibrio aerogenes CECT 7868]
MSKRPWSVKIISWFLMIAGVMTLISVFISTNNPEVMEIMKKSMIPVHVQIIFSYVGSVITFICGLQIHRGKIAGRHLYIGWTIVSLIISLIVTPDKKMIVPGLIFSATIIFFLFSAKATEFFRVE